jgi:ABC-type lipoprotein release transport system permease subunit
MTSSLVTRFAVRTLGRNVRRTLLSVVGIGVGSAVAIYISAFMRGAMEMRVRAISESGFGHLRIAPATWETSRNNDLRLNDWQDMLTEIRTMGDVRVAAPHVRSTALLAFGTRVAGVEMLGVDPTVEQKLNRLVRIINEGRYLTPDDWNSAVIGRTIARRLEVEVDDDLLLTVVGPNGEMEYAMLRIVGIVETGSRDLDATICHVTLEGLERLTGRPGAGEITIDLDHPSKIDRIQARLRTLVSDGSDVLTWKEVVPSQGGDAASDVAFANLMIGIVAVVVILGVASAQLTAILERKRELAVLIALGMRGLSLIRLLLLEAIVLGLLGAVLGLLIATPIVGYSSATGFDFAEMFEGDFNLEGVLFEPVVYPHMGPWMIPHGFAVALISTLVAALYPAWYALRTDPTSALSLREA